MEKSDVSASLCGHVEKGRRIGLAMMQAAHFLITNRRKAIDKFVVRHYIRKARETSVYTQR